MSPSADKHPGPPADDAAAAPAGEAGKPADRRMGVQVIARAAEICRELATAVDGLSTAELVERLHLSRPTVYRILRALMDEDFVRQVGPGRFAIGPAFLVIAGSTYGGLRHDMRPFMKDLSNEIGETIDLAMLDAGEALFVDQFVAVRGLRVVAHMGARLPLHCTASGKALLAVLEPDEIDRELPKRLQGYTPNTVTDRAALLRAARRHPPDRSGLRPRGVRDGRLRRGDPRARRGRRGRRAHGRDRRRHPAGAGARGARRQGAAPSP